MEIFVFLCWIAFACAVGYVAGERGRSGVAWGFVAFLFSPILTLIVLLLITDLKKEQQLNAERTRAEYAQPQTVRPQATAPPLPTPTQRSVDAAATPLAPELVATELEKLSALVDKGRLTLDEYNEQKTRILGRGPQLHGATPGLATPAVPLPSMDEAKRAQLERQLSGPDDCVAALRRSGCEVRPIGAEEWEIKKPSGITEYARSVDSLKRVAMSFATA